MILQNQNQVFQPVAAVISSGPPPPPPAAPSGFDIFGTEAELTDIHMGWTNNAVPAATTNEIWTSVNGNPYTFFDSVPGNVNDYHDTSGTFGGSPGDVWSYKVRAVNGGGSSAFSNEKSAAEDLGNLHLVNYNYPTLRVIFGSFGTGGTGVAVTVNLPELQAVKGDITFNSEPNLTTFSTPELNFVTGGMFFDGCLLLTPISFPALATVFGSVVFSGCSAAPSIDLPNLIGDIQDFNANFTSGLTVGFTLKVTRVASFSMTESAVPSISLPNLTQVTTADFGSRSNPNMTSISAPTLFEVSSGAVMLDGNSVLTSISMDSLGNVAGALDVSSNLAALPLSFPALVAADSWNSTSGGITSLSLTGGYLAASDFLAGNCSALANVDLSGGFTIVDGITIDFSGCGIVPGDSATFTGMNGILAACVANGLTGSTINLDGGTNTGFAALSAQGQADFATLTGNGCTVNINP